MAMPSIGSAVIYHTYNRYGDVIRRQKRVVARHLPNINGVCILEWRATKDSGACMVSTWEEWADGTDEKKRRGLTVWRAPVKRRRH